METAAAELKSIFGGGSPEPSATVTAIFIYPVKSCRGISVPRACISPTGFRWDRQWMVVNSNGRACTQRHEPKIALVEVELPEDAFTEDWETNDSSYLALRAPGMDVLKVPLNKQSDVINEVSVWEWSGSAYDEGADASNWFSEYLGKPSRLVRFNSSSEIRVVDPNYVQGHKTMFSDEFPFLLISQGSLEALNKLVHEPVLINRFRPNILVDGCEPFSEDLWRTIKLNKLTFNGVKLCARCKITTINQENGISDFDPREVLMKSRSDHALGTKGKRQGKVFFGQNFVCKESTTPGRGKVVTVGDPVYVLQTISSPAEAAV